MPANMVDIPEELARSIQAGDCVLWVGAGFGALCGRPSWEQLLARLVPTCPEDVQEPLRDLIEQGRLRTVLTYVHRHFGDEPLAKLLKEVMVDADATPLADGSEVITRLPWRACFATTYADVAQRIFAVAGAKPEVLTPNNVHHLSLRERKDLFILRTPPTGRAMRADAAFYDLVEEAVRSRTILFLGFEPDDPDLIQILDLLDRIGRGNPHYAVLPWVSAPEAEELRERFAIELITAPTNMRLPQLFADLVAACGRVAVRPSDVEGKIAALEMTRAMRGIDVRADLAIDEALTLEIETIENLISALPGANPSALSSPTLLRVGSVMLAHGRLDKARRILQQIVSRDTGREYQNLARFNLALCAIAEGDRAAALDGLVSAAENDRSLALVPPRFEVREVLARIGSETTLLCRDRETREDLEVSVSMLSSPVGIAEQKRFTEAVQRLAGVDHPAIRGVRGGFADGRLFGIVRAPIPGFVLADTLEPAPVPLAQAFEVIGRVLDGLSACHARGVLHRNLNPHHVVLGPDGATLRGFGFPPLVGFSRPSVRATNRGYLAPEVLAGQEATPATDVYAVGALLYRLLTGRLAEGAVPPPSSIAAGVDPRIDSLVAHALHPDPRVRPPLGRIREQIEHVLATPGQGKALAAVEPAAASREQTVDLGRAASPAREVPQPAPEAAAVAAPMEQLESAPLSIKIQLPEDRDDLEAWAWILERKPTHIDARDAIARIENESRGQGRWDRVAEVIKVRAQHAQVQRERVELLRELVDLYERKLAAPASAFESMQLLVEEVPVGEQVRLADELVRLAEVTGQWSELGDSLLTVAERATDPDDQARLYGELGQVYAGRLGATDRAVAAYEKAIDLHPDADNLSAVVPLYRKLARHPQTAAALLSLADLQSGVERVDSFMAAVKVLREDLADDEGALGAVEVVIHEAPDHEPALEVAESLARTLERWPLLVEVLARRATATLDDTDAIARLREATDLALSRLDDRTLAADLLAKLLARRSDDRDAATRLVTLLRDQVTADVSKRAPLIDGLGVLVDLVELPDEKAALLAETATLLDQEPDGRDRASDCRQRILELLPLDRPVCREAAATLEKQLRRNEDHHALLDLLLRLARSPDADDAMRSSTWHKVLQLRKGPLPDDAGAIEALEALTKLEPEETRWRDALLELYLAAEEFKRAGPLIRAQVLAEKDPKRKAELLLRGGILREQIGKMEGAVEALEEAVALDPSLTQAWLALRDLYLQREQPLKAIEAQVAAARSTGNRGERTRLLFEAARKFLDDLDLPARALELLAELVELDPDHREATGILLEHLVAQGDLARAWPFAQTYVLQVRAQAPTDHVLNLRALSLAGRCALAVQAKDRAREYLEKAKTLDATNLDVLRLLAELDMEAGRFSDGLRHYQSVVLGVGEKLPPPELSRLYVRMAEARIGMEEPHKAVQMAERAFEIDPDSEDAIGKLIELSAHAGGAAALVKAKRRLADLLARRETKLDADDPSATEARGRRIALLDEIAKTQAEDLRAPEEAVRTLEEVLKLTPDDPGVLHRMLDLLTANERWRDATNVLARLAEAQAADAIRAKYLYAGAVIFRDHLGDKSSATEWLMRVLDANPQHDKAFAGYTELLEKTQKWHELARAIRARLKSLPDSTPPERHVEMFWRLGEVYERMEDHKTALAAFHQAAQLSPRAGEPEPTQRVRREKAMKLAVHLGDDELDKAVTHAHGLIAIAPMEFEVYHRLVELYLKQGRKDRARALARTLKFLKQADEAELELTENVAPGTPRSTVTRDLWRQCIYHATEDLRLSDLFALMWPIVAAREGRTHAHLGIKRDQRVEVTLQSPTAVSRYLAHACQVLDSPVPDLFLRETEAGGIVVHALSDSATNSIYPTLVAGKDALADNTETGLKFRAGRAITRARPEHILALVVPSPPLLRIAAWAAVVAAQAGTDIPPDVRSDAEQLAQKIERFLPPARLDQLKMLAARIAQGGDVDTRGWAHGVAYTATRAGFALCDSLEVAAQTITREGDEAGGLPTKERIRDLIGYSVSEPYLRLRKELGLAR